MLKKITMQRNLKEITLTTTVVLSLIGLLGLSIIDENARPAFQKVAEMTIAAYLGYLIPNK